MDGYQFTAAVLAALLSLAWPVALIVAVALFREELRKLLPLLHVKHKDWEASFRLDKAERDAAALPDALRPDEAMPTPEEVDRFEQIADLSPAAAILEQRRAVEEAVRRKAEGLTSPPIPRSFVAGVRALRKHGLIDPRLSAILDDLRSIGNSAAHDTSATELTKEDAMRYRRLADLAIWQLSLE
jgi:hypothetical protein